MSCLGRILRVSRLGKIKNIRIKHVLNTGTSVPDRIATKWLKYFGHIKRMATHRYLKVALKEYRVTNQDAVHQRNDLSVWPVTVNHVNRRTSHLDTKQEEWPWTRISDSIISCISHHRVPHHQCGQLRLRVGQSQFKTTYNNFPLLWLEIPSHACSSVGIKAYQKGSFLDGLHGFNLCCIMAFFYCTSISCSLKE